MKGMMKKVDSDIHEIHLEKIDVEAAFLRYRKNIRSPRLSKRTIYFLLFKYEQSLWKYVKKCRMTLYRKVPLSKERELDLLCKERFQDILWKYIGQYN